MFRKLLGLIFTTSVKARVKSYQKYFLGMTLANTGKREIIPLSNHLKKMTSTNEYQGFTCMYRNVILASDQ